MDSNFALFLGLITGLVVYVFTGLTSKKKITKENFLPSMTFKVDKVVAPNPDFAGKGEFWSVPGKYQSLVAPRSASVQYGSQIQYNLPAEDHLAFRRDTPFANDGLSLSTGSEVVQPITYDRFMFSNKRSRLREHGDPIRGDLPIIPHNSDWFRPSVQPHIDLKEGAMQVMGGFDNETNNKLSQLMAASAGNAMQTFGGVNFSGSDGLSQNMGAYFRSSDNDQNQRSSLHQRMSSAPQYSNVETGQLEATGMVPTFNLDSAFGGAAGFDQSAVYVDRAGDVNVMRG